MRPTFFKAAALTALASLASASDVIDLTKDSFAATAGGSLSLIEFFAPWCGHCKALAPHYEEAATILKDEGITLAKVDCTAEAELCSANGVSGYPTLKVFRNGDVADYGGTRKTDGIVSYMRKQSLPAVSDVTADNHDEFKEADKIVVVGYFDAADEMNKAVFTGVAEAHRDDYLFGISTDSAAAAGVKAPTVVLYKKFDEGRNDIAGDVEPEGLTDFIREHAVPVLDEISPENFATYAESGLPLAYIFVEATDPKRESLVKELEPVAREHKGKINFVWIDATKFADHGKSLNLNPGKWPAFAIQNIQAMTKFPLDQSKTVDFKTVSQFASDFAAGKISPSIKSEPVPTVQDEPVYVLVADEWDKVVGDESKDLFVEFYAPWCGHCKRLKPIWDELGEKYADVRSKLMIAKFEATANDVPASAGFRVTGFPTIKFRPAGSKRWLSYQGDRSLENLVDFVESNAVNDLSVPDSTSAEEPATEAKPHDEL